MKNKKFYAALLGLIFFNAAQLKATDYYASPEGSGSGLSYSAPGKFTTLVSKLVAGDVLYLLGGQYDFSSTVSVSVSGKSGNYVLISNYPGEEPVFDFRKQTYGKVGLQLGSIEYLHLKGVKVQYAGKNGIHNKGSYCILENCTAYRCGDTGIQQKGGGGNLIKNCDSYENFDYQLINGSSQADFGGNADGFADKQYTNSNANTYEGCRSWRNSDDGWDFYQRVGNTVINNSVCYQNGPEYYDMTNHPRYEVDKAWFDSFPKTIEGRDGVTYTITLAKYKNFGNGNGFKLGGDKTVHNVTLNNCLTAENTVGGFDQNNDAGAMVIYNGSAYNNGRNYKFSSISGSSLTVKNSVSLATQSSDGFSCPTLVTSNNTWNTSGVSCSAADFESLDASLITTARQADGSLTSNLFMRLAEGSDLIDKGVNVGLAYSGTAPDLGCFEYGETLVYPATVNCTSANASQTVKEGAAITPVIFKWSGSATSLEITELPDGLSSSLNETAQTLTISGSIALAGNYSYTVSTVAESGETASVDGVFTVRSASAKQIAYVTLPGDERDEMILATLNGVDNFSVTILDATSTANTYAGYDLVVLSPVPGSTAAGMAAIESISNPRLMLKPFQLKSSCWNWGVPANTSDASVKVTDATHAIFNDVQITDNELDVFSSVSTNGITVISSWVGSPNVKELATAISGGQSIVEIPVGTVMNGTTVSSKFLMIGISEYSAADLTPAACRLITNSCRYLMDMATGEKTPSAIPALKVHQLSGQISVSAENEIAELAVLSVSGMKIAQSSGNVISTSSLKSGVYILAVTDVEGKRSYIKFALR